MKLERAQQRFLDWACRPRVRRTGVGIGLLVVLYGLAGFGLVPLVLESQAVKQIATALNRRAVIEKIRFNPFTLEARVKGFTLMEPEGGEVFASFDELVVNFEIQSLWRLGPVLSKLHLRRPFIHIARRNAQHVNISDIVAAAASQEAVPRQKPLPFAVSDIVVEGGRCRFDDLHSKATHELADVTLVVPQFASLSPAITDSVEASLAAVLNGAVYTVSVRVRPFGETVTAEVDARLNGLDVVPYLPYFPVPPAAVLTSGRIDMNLGLRFSGPSEKGGDLRLKGGLALRNLFLASPAGDPLINLDTIDLSIEDVDLIGGTATVGRVVVDGLVAHVVRTADGRINLLDLAPSAPRAALPASAPGSGPAPNPAFALTVGEVAVPNARLHLLDRRLPGAFTATVAPLNLSLRGLHLPAGPPATLEVTAAADAGETFSLNAAVSPQPLAVEGRVRFGGLGLKRFAPYYQDALNARIDGGTLSGEATASVDLAGGRSTVSVRGIAAALEGFVLRLKQSPASRPLLEIGRLTVADGVVDPVQREIRVGEMAWHQGQLAVTRNKDGRVDALGIVPAAPPAGDGGRAASEKDWNLSLERLRIEDVGLDLEDQTAVETVKLKLDKIHLTADHLSGSPGAKAGVAFNALINDKGRVAVSGRVGLKPLDADVKLDVRALDLAPARPYLAGMLDADITSGALDLNGRLTVAQPEAGSLRGGWAGDVGVNAFTLRRRGAERDLAKWKSLFFERVEARSDPAALTVESVALSDFDVRLVLSPEGRLNIHDLVPGPTDETVVPTAAEAPAKDAAAQPRTTAAGEATSLPDLTVRSITFQGGQVRFTDNFIKPNYSARLFDLGGKVTGLSTDPSSRAALNLRGQVNHAPLSIAGTLNPLIKDIRLDIKADVKGMDLVPLTPYAAKYVGYGIEKGKLSFEAGYKVENGQLTASNRLVLDQLTFGAKIESPTATKLPVMLAVSLLKDHNGVIDINLPIGGSLNDPQFSVGAVLSKVVGGLITKAVTAPFALLGAIAGGEGKDLSVVVFPPGVAGIDAAAEASLKDLAMALAQRPGLHLEIAGRADGQTDGEGLGRAQIRRKVLRLKRADVARKAPGADPAAVTVTDEEYPRLLERVYKSEPFPKPRNIVGLVKELPVEEMEKLMLAHAGIDDNALTGLANRRAQAVKDWLVAEGKIASERLFVVGPRVGPADRDAQQAPASRVELAIKR